jgi:hypothetical protein
MKIKKKSQKPVKKFLEYYYMIPKKTDAKSLSQLVKSVEEDCIEVWRELNLMEIVLDSDSLIFEDAKECFIDPLDLAFLKEHQIETIYQVSFEKQDTKKVSIVLEEIMGEVGGFLASDSEDFTPIYTKKEIHQIGE